jgi:uncharacterized protein (DUF608 family)
VSDDASMFWTNTPRDEAGVPLGGIGAGKIEFCRNGRFTNVTTNNNLDAPIVDGYARIPLFPRVKEGAPGSVRENALRRQSVNAPEGLPGGWLALHTEDEGATLLKTVGRLACTPIAPERIVFEGRFPRARVHYRGFSQLEVCLDAFCGFDPLDPAPDYRNSALPLALFLFTLTNRASRARAVGLAFSWQNLNGIGGYPMTMINTPDPTVPRFRDDAAAAGVWFGHDPDSIADPRVLGNHSVRVISPDVAVEITHHCGWNPTGEGREVWQPFARDGRFDDRTEGSTAAALGARVRLAPAQSARVLFALGWYMPHLLAAETRWDHLIRPASAPAAPESHARADYGHAYQNWFSDSWQVAGHGLGQWQTILGRIEAWQGALDASSLPALATTGLCNDLCALLCNTWYTRAGHYAVNEAPTDMNGCFGTIDQRSVGCGAVALSFPALNRAELALFAADQIRDHDEARRFGVHWNSDGGNFDRPLDRAGAILHDVGFDHLEGGRTGGSVWASLHWPELTSHFILQCYQYALWSGDRAWLDERYPQMQRALEFQLRLDQDGDGVADLWGPGSSTYDTELYPHYGASAYVTSLYLAALRVVMRLAEERGEREYVRELERRFTLAGQVMERELFDEQRGYYCSWRDRKHACWKGQRAHAARSSSSHISQLAGCWWADMLGLDPIVEPARRRRALDFISRHNVAAVAGCPADEYQLDGTTMQSMSALAMGNYAAHAIGAGLADQGWNAARNIYQARYAHDGCPWDATLQWSGPDNLAPQWGRWYMSHPASWLLLPALGGVRIDRLRGLLTLCPSWPSEWGAQLRALPVFLPGFQLTVDAERTASSLQVTITAGELNAPVSFSSVCIILPLGYDPARTEVRLAGFESPLRATAEGRVTTAAAVRFARRGDRLDYSVHAT